MSFNLTNVQGIVSKSALAGQAQDAVHRGHELAAEHAAKSLQEEHEIDIERVKGSEKLEEHFDRDADPQDILKREKESEGEVAEEPDENSEEEPPLGKPDAFGHIDITV